MKLASSVQRKLIDLTPVPLLEMLCRARPKFAIEFLCHCINEKNVDVEERGFAPIKPTLLPVVKKMSQLSVLSILNLLRQDESLWRFYLAGVGTISFKILPYLLLELMYELGGSEGRKKVLEVVQRARQTIGGRKQGDIFENFRTDNVIDIFEKLPEVEVRMRLSFSEAKAVALWLTYWDEKMIKMGKPAISPDWLVRLPGSRAFQIQKLMHELEFRRPKVLQEEGFEEE